MGKNSQLSSYRSERVAEQIHKEVSRLLLAGIKDPRVASVTITGVNITRDLRLARIYFTVSDEKLERREAEAGLKSAAAYIRREIGQVLGLRFVPDFRFEYDSSISYGHKIDNLLRQVKDDLKDASEDSPTDQE
jgi:ribosome-binding factor A